MTVTITPAGGFAGCVAGRIVAQVQRKPESVLCFSTGSTTEPVFGEIVRLQRDLDIDFSGVFAFNVDNYLDMPEGNPASVNARIKKDLYVPLGLRAEQYYIPTAASDKAEEEIGRFKGLIEQKKGIDLLLLSVGGNGHIAFNEPGTPFESDIYVAKISRSTIAAKTALFGGEGKVPRFGITMGIKTLMQARSILLVACGAHKAEIIGAALNGPVTAEVPASVLQLHPFVEAILDEAAGRNVK